jgi:hypothetical protein
LDYSSSKYFFDSLFYFDLKVILPAAQVYLSIFAFQILSLTLLVLCLAYIQDKPFCIVLLLIKSFLHFGSSSLAYVLNKALNEFSYSGFLLMFKLS